MPVVTRTFPDGNTLCLFERQGKYFPVIPGVDLDVVLSSLPELPARDDDVMILTYPKAGTHWTFEIANMLVTGEAQTASRDKRDSMIEFKTADELDKLPSVRLLNTHLDPDFYPRDLIKRKCRVIFTQRNPKDSLVSCFHHVRRMPSFTFEGDWESYYKGWMEKGAYLRWFEWTKQWEKFFSDHPDIPVLRLLFEEMKTDLDSAVNKVAEFLGVSCGPAFRQMVVEKCSFGSMKAGHILPNEVQQQFHNKAKDNPIFRKGIVGDWKNYFTVAQNEWFDEEYKRLMEGYTFGFEKYI